MPPRPRRLTDADVRAFVARQERPGTRAARRLFRRLHRRRALHRPGLPGDKPPVPYGTSTLAQARAQAPRRSRRQGPARPAESFASRSPPTAPRPGRLPRGFHARGRRPVRRLCATESSGGARQGRLRSRGQTDTFIDAADSPPLKIGVDVPWSSAGLRRPRPASAPAPRSTARWRRCRSGSPAPASRSMRRTTCAASATRCAPCSVRCAARPPRAATAGPRPGASSPPACLRARGFAEALPPTWTTSACC
jgi:hypothetical protein